MNERLSTITLSQRDGRTIILHGLRLLRRYHRLFLAVGIGTVIVGCGATLSLRRSFVATATVVVSPTGNDPVGNRGGQQAESLSDDELATQAGLLQSRDVAAAVLRSLPPSAGRAGFSLKGMLCAHGLHLACPKAAKADPAAEAQAQVDRLLGAVTIAPMPRSRIISITVNADDGQRAADLANAFVVQYQQLALDRQRADLNRTAAWVDSRTAQLRERWLEAATKASTFNATHKLSNTGDGAGNGPLIEREMSETAVSLTQAQGRLAAAEARADALARASTRGEARALVTLTQQPILVATANTLQQLDSARMQKAAALGPHHPDLAGLDRQIATTRASLAAETHAALASINEDAMSARAEVAQLAHDLDRLRQEASSQGSPQAEYRMLTQEAQSAREVYEAFLERSKELVDRVALLQPPVTFVSHAATPDSATFPNRKKLLMGVIVLSLVAAAGAVFLRDLFSSGFGEVEQLRALVGLPLLTAIPRIAGRDRRSVRRHVLDNPFSPASEAVRSLLAQLSLSAPKTTGRGRVIVVASASTGEGKSSLAAWLAGLARTGGQPVLVIDGDHREGTPGRAPLRPGLTELLAGEASVADVVRPDLETGVDFLPAGAPKLFPFDTTEIARLRDMLKELGRSYSLIVIDSPPLLAMPDGLVYGALADQTVFVCRWLSTSRSAVLSSIERLRSYGAHVSGVVVSMAEEHATANPGARYGRQDTQRIALHYDS
ncbi:polysaccharide biosynthesis tyrosine autokinase [Gluconacetobacter azotocaptans]|uniref:Polysaccharide biosynthesis tyrosine autokinase n=1 Tax=Gluconacetobacter azotocaptans TaxID=142834 RepID=A0A7W4JPH3_9PROT|nr:polysaccharide biosynthesis tyrosine autokinase [Gluconacetobacter azotocaptans]MBB2188530.1 polysaccharide biosynthesis tyrosine autokinase [Gluconacetobacter azotocaptans]GBQ28077.1 protein-tyrosine kinase [Gluconacetobacter azotocaptans DSM 13594]